MNKFTIEDIRKLEPCYDPSKYLAEDWEGTALDILRMDDVSAIDRLWVICHQDWIDDRTLRLFAVWCARQALALVRNPDPRSVAACDVAERYANGDATETELRLARNAAVAAARALSRDVSWAAAGAAAWAAAPSDYMAAAKSSTWYSVELSTWKFGRVGKLQVKQLIYMLDEQDKPGGLPG